MGCSNSAITDDNRDAKDSSKGPPVTRRRLTQTLETTDEQVATTNADDNRGLIAMLDSETILQVLDASGNSGGKERKTSVSSVSEFGAGSFQVKSTQAMGDGSESDLCLDGVGCMCRKGKKPDQPNQDSWAVLRVDNMVSIYGVYDGHGQKGHDISNYVKENMPKLILKDERFKTMNYEPVLRDAFMRTQGLIDTLDKHGTLNAALSGTTATVAVHDHSANRLVVANVADSTCVLGRYKGTGASRRLEAVRLSVDHKPNLAEERARIEAAGGRVVWDNYANYRVYCSSGKYPGLNMSRCLGDLLAHRDAGCSAVPDVISYELCAEDHVLLLCSDGVWEFITPEEAVRMVSDCDPSNATTAADALAKKAWDRWIIEENDTIVDDITVILVYLQQLKGQRPNGAQSKYGGR